MQDNEKDEELSIHLKQFIYYVNKAIRHKVIDFDRAQNWRKSN